MNQKQNRKPTTVAIAMLAIMFIAACGGDEDPSIGSITQAIVDEGHPWTHGDWSSRVRWEARRALSRSANGTSTISTGSGLTKTYYGDWNYVGSDTYAHSKASAEAGGYEDGWVGETGYYNKYYAGGWCAYFVRLVLYRSTYWAFNDHYTTPNYGTGKKMYDIEYTISEFPETIFSSPSQWQPGWPVYSKKAYHFMIADQRATIGGYTGWWVIDSNYVDTFRIGKHFFKDSDLISKGYYGWKPSRGSDND